MLSVCLCFVVIVYSARVCGSEGDLTVQTNYGHVRGMTTERVPGKRIHTFLGIPYASPPVKDLRFEVQFILFKILDEKNIFIKGSSFMFY